MGRLPWPTRLLRCVLGAAGLPPPGNCDVWSALILTHFPVNDLIHAFAEYALCPCASFLGGVNMIIDAPGLTVGSPVVSQACRLPPNLQASWLSLGHQPAGGRVVHRHGDAVQAVHLLDGMADRELQLARCPASQGGVALSVPAREKTTFGIGDAASAGSCHVSRL